MKNMLKFVLWFLAAYLIGSIPWGLVIGKIFFDTDIREYGSGNLGGTNAGRVLGTRYGILVILLDGLKALLLMTLAHFVSPGIERFAGLGVCIGHCFPLFAGFKGGKAVACTYGYLVGLALYVNHEWLFTFLLPWLLFFLILAATRMVSLSSMVSVTSAAFLIFFFVNRTSGILVFLLALFVIYRHKANIQRILNGTESKIGTKKKEIPS